MSNSGKRLIDAVRQTLRPQGTSNLVRIGFNDGVGGHAFFDSATIKAAIDCMERQTTIAQSGLDDLNSLETLAIQLLMSSAYLGTQAEINDFLKRTENEDDQDEICQ